LLKTRSGRRASQRADELLPFIDFLKERDVRSYLEIGARHGDTFYEVMKSLPKGSVGVAVDLPGGAWGVESSRGYLEDAAKDLRGMGYHVATVYGDSTSQAVVDAVIEAFGWYDHRGPVDAILIDGDHRYEGVSADWHVWGPFAPVIAFHDIAGEGQIQPTTKDVVEVPRLWNELKPHFTTKEWVGAESTMGIGVIVR